MFTAGVTIYYRYYFYAKIQSKWSDYLTEEEQQEMANINKRDWGKRKYFQPKLANSRKKKLYE